MTATKNTDLIAMAEIVGVHGIKGIVKLKIFGNDAENLLDYETLTDASGKKTFTLVDIQPHGTIHLAEIEGLTDRTAAEKLRGTILHIPKSELPAIEDEGTFYHVDLIGLAASYPDGKPLGKVVGVANFGAGDLIEVKPLKGASFYVPFTNDAVPHVDIAKKEITIDPPPGLLD